MNSAEFTYYLSIAIKFHKLKRIGLWHEYEIVYRKTDNLYQLLYI